MLSGMSDVYAVRGRPTGRGRPRGPLLHAVPENDRTRSALCGARVGGETLPWPEQRAAPRIEQLSRPEPPTCPECASLVTPAAG